MIKIKKVKLRILKLQKNKIITWYFNTVKFKTCIQINKILTYLLCILQITFAWNQRKKT